MPFNQRQIIEQAKFAYSPLGKTFEKQTKTTEDQVQKQVKALEVLKPEEKKEYIESIKGLFPKEMRTNEIINEIDEIKKWEEKTKWKDLKYETNKYIYDFQQFGTINLLLIILLVIIFTGTISVDKAEMDQSNL